MVAKDTIRKLPRKPGVYLLKDASGTILYVGKAVDLRSRVASHFKEGGPRRPPFAPRTEEVDYIVTDTEKEALLLENNLIKEHWPRYNVRLKDDSSPAHIRLSVNEKYPSLSVTRNIRKDGARYFGPYLSADAARKTIRFLQGLFPLRDCSLAEFASRTRPCIKHQIKRCSGPCRGLIGDAKYRELVRRVTLFLSGRTGSLLRTLRKEMESEARRLHYERAREKRDTIDAITRTIERQKIVALNGADRDAIGLYRNAAEGEAAILCFRGGKLIGRTTPHWEGEGQSDGAVVREIILRHYLGGAFIPPEILVPVFPDDRRAIEETLSDERGGRARLVCPRRGGQRALVAMASSNAEASFASRRDKDEELQHMLLEMQKRLHLPAPPRSLECVDISHIGGAAAVGTVAAFDSGAPRKEGYRQFRIKTAKGADDCRMIYEVLARRARRGAEGWGLPDLIVVDGGKGQLHAALRALREHGAARTAAVALAKARGGEVTEVPDRVFIEGRKNAIRLREGDRVSLFLQRVRDEAHRCALLHHRERRTKELFASELDALAGVGAKRRSLLLAAFGSVRGVAEAPLGALEHILGSRAVARRVKDYFREKGGGGENLKSQIPVERGGWTGGRIECQ